MITDLVPYAEYIHSGSPQHCVITATALNGNTLTLTEADIRQGGFSYDARSTSGDVLELGSTIAAQLTLSLSAVGNINSFAWYGARLNVQIGVEAGGAVVYGSLGEFVVDEADRRYDIWTITALDNLVRFDKTLTDDEWATVGGGLLTVENVIRTACNNCGVTVGTLDNLLNNSSALPSISAQSNATWRNVLQWCGEFAGVCFYCDGIGRLCCKWYAVPQTATDTNTISTDKRYRSNVSADDVILTGIIVNTDEYSYTYGIDKYRLEIDGNPFFAEANAQTAVNALGNRLNNFYYAPFDAATVPFIYLSAMDGCYVYSISNAFDVATIVTHIAFTLNGSCAVEAVGKSIQSKSYNNGSAFTRQQAIIVDEVKQQLSEYVNQRTLAIRNLNTLMANAMGLQFEERNGKWYFYNAVDNGSLENATIIYTFVDNGFAWASGENAWNDGNPVWNNGITVDGNAYLNQINATGITVAKETSDFVTEISPGLWQLLFNTKPLITASGSTGQGILQLDKVDINNDGGYIHVGKARLYGTSTGMDIVIEG